MASPLESYAYNPKKELGNLGKERKSRLRDLTEQFAGQRVGLDVAQRQSNEQLGQDINRFAAINRLDPGSGTLLKFREDTQNKQAQDYAAQKAALGAEEAKSREGLNAEIGQRRLMTHQLNLAMDESAFNKQTAKFQAILAANDAGINRPDQWARLIGGPNGALAQLFGKVPNFGKVTQRQVDLAATTAPQKPGGNPSGLGYVP
jgi:hypothetical protein